MIHSCYCSKIYFSSTSHQLWTCNLDQESEFGYFLITCKGNYLNSTTISTLCHSYPLLYDRTAIPIAEVFKKRMSQFFALIKDHS